MGNCVRKKVLLNPGSVLDRVISQASNDDDCILYKLADYKKGGELIEAYGIGGMVEVEKLIREQFGILMYKDGEGQVISRTEFLRWKFRNVKQVVIPVEATSATDPLGKWVDHEACWQMQYRGSLGETLLHLLIMCDTRLHTRLARVLLHCYPKLALDVFEGEEYLGASALHLAIAYTNNEIVHMLVDAGARVEQRAIGSFFLPRDQQRIPPSKLTDYEGLAYFGEYPLAWAACVGNESVYNLLLDKGAHPDWQDSFGNMILHMVVVTDQLGMYGYALRHPKIVASNGVMNHQGLTPLTLACRLGRASVFREMLELSCREFWRFSNHTCSAYPLNALDSISPDGKTNWNSALFMILEGRKEEHLDMLDGGIIQRLLEEKWKTFAQRQFMKRITIAFLHLFVMSFAVYLRPTDRAKSLLLYDEPVDFFRLGFELCTILSCISYVVFQQGEEIKNQGFVSFLKQLPQSPPKALFLLANFTILGTIPLRFLGELALEEAFLTFSMVGSWFFMMFFAGAVKLTGPFITMIFSMVTGDMLTFGIIYAIFLLAFSQAFYYLYKTHPTLHDLLFETYPKTWMALYQMTLGSYSYNDLSLTVYPNMAKGVFIAFMILVPILLLNMLIAMMGNTYSQVIERSEKEWVKQWAKLVVSLERAISQDLARQHIQEYSIKLPGGGIGEELRGVMVIKTKNKTRAKQRKGALCNWKRVGKVTINALKKRGMTGEEMRILMWGHRASVSTPQPTTTQQPSAEFTDPLLGMNKEIGNGIVTGNPANGAIRQSEGVIGSSLTPFGCFDDPMPAAANTALCNTPANTSLHNKGTVGMPTPSVSSAALSSLPPAKASKKSPLTETSLKQTPELVNERAESLTSSLQERVSTGRLGKGRRRNITSGLRPKIVVFSGRKDMIRVNLDSEDSESEILYNASLDIKSEPQISTSENSTILKPPEEHVDTKEEGIDNTGFVQDEGMDSRSVTLSPEEKVIEAASVTLQSPPRISVTEDDPVISSPVERQTSAMDLEETGAENETSIEQPQQESSKNHKKRKERTRSAKPGGRNGKNSKDGRPQTAFSHIPAEEVESMNNLIAWDRPEQDI